MTIDEWKITIDEWKITIIRRWVHAKKRLWSIDSVSSQRKMATMKQKEFVRSANGRIHTMGSGCMQKHSSGFSPIHCIHAYKGHMRLQGTYARALSQADIALLHHWPLSLWYAQMPNKETLWTRYSIDGLKHGSTRLHHWPLSLWYAHMPNRENHWTR